jgi:hypothetical protein
VLLALDTLLAFAIVATMIWFGRIGGLPGPYVLLWEVAVICNVLGVGVERLYSSLRAAGAFRVKAKPPAAPGSC